MDLVRVANAACRHRR
ncbi:hypothetical protein [Nocardia jinanensis]